MEHTLDILVSLGLPSAIVAMVLIALIFKRDHAKISTSAGWSAIGLVGILGIGQVVEIWRGQVSIDIAPSNVYAFDDIGHPVEVAITAERAGSTLESVTIKEIPDSQYADRSLALGPGDDGLTVMYHDQPIGKLNRRRLVDVGWQPGAECNNGDAGDPKFWSTHRVYVGRPHHLGNTRYGALKLIAKSFTGDGKAVVTLGLEGHESPIPNALAIANKGLGIQSFSAVPEFYIAVREADFTVDPPWAAFNVFSIQ